jgi:multisubunit Na+/H+ antiporter MnhB subunit
MTTHPDLREIEQRSRRYWNVDGIPELMMGLVWMLWGGALILGQALPKGAVAGVYWGVVPAILVSSGFASNWATKKLKERLTYPRTGYVEYRDPGRTARLLGAGVAALSAAGLAALIVAGMTQGLEHTVTPALALIVSLGFVIASVRQRAPHLLVLSGVALALAIGFASLNLGWESLSWMFVSLGVAGALLGGWRFGRYVKLNPRPEEAQ